MPYFAVTMGNYSSEREIINIPTGKISLEFTTAVLKCSSSKILRRDKYLCQKFILHEQAHAHG